MSPTHLLVAYDFSEASERSLRVARALRAKLHAAVDVVHVYQDPFAELKHPPRESAWSTPEQLGANLLALGEQVRSRVADAFGPDAQAIRCHVRQGDLPETIFDIATEVGADLLVVGTTGKTGVERALLGSVSHKLLRESRIPVLLVP